MEKHQFVVFEKLVGKERKKGVTKTELTRSSEVGPEIVIGESTSG